MILTCVGIDNVLNMLVIVKCESSNIVFECASSLTQLLQAYCMLYASQSMFITDCDTPKRVVLLFRMTSWGCLEVPPSMDNRMFQYPIPCRIPSVSLPRTLRWSVLDPQGLLRYVTGGNSYPFLLLSTNATVHHWLPAL